MLGMDKATKYTSMCFLFIQISVCFCREPSLALSKEAPPPLVWNLQIQESPGHEVPPDSPYPQLAGKKHNQGLS